MSIEGSPPSAMRLPEPRTTTSGPGVERDGVERDGSAEAAVEVATYDLGGTGADLLMVHATGFCAGVWTPVAARLVDRHRVAALDVRGHGRTEAPPSGMHWSGTATDVLATIDALGLKRPFGVGHSMGGASLILAEQRRPGTFRGLWLFEPIIFPTQWRTPDASGNPLAAGARRRRDTFDSPTAAFENFASKPPMSAFAPEALAAYVEHGFETLPDGSVTLRCVPEIEAQTYEMGSEHDAYDHLADVRCPVVVARGSAAPPGPAGFAPLIAEGLPEGRLEEHPELGHFGPLEDPAAIASAIEDAVTAAS